jgi:tRNA (guanosine-2'-O-)-methyltransferase
VFGNERRGVSGLVRARADICAVLPMAGFSQSFNISAATTLFLAHLRHKGKFVGDLPTDELEALYLRWLIAAVGKNAKDIIESAGLLDEVPFL